MIYINKKWSIKSSSKWSYQGETNFMEKPQWIESIENDFDLYFFDTGADEEGYKAYFEPATGGGWVIEIDSLSKQILVNKPTHWVSGKEKKLPCHHNQGKSVSKRLLENIKDWNDIGIETKFRSIEEIDIWFKEESYKWLIRFDGKEKKMLLVETTGANFKVPQLDNIK